MSNVLPVIEMPKPPEHEPEPLITNAPDNKLPENASGMDLMSAVISDFQKKGDLSDDDIIRVDEREIPSEDEVFNDPPPKVKSVSLEEQEEPEEPSEFPSEMKKKGKRKYTRKAPMSDKQKEHLAKIRKIAQEKRRAEKERKQKEKEEAVIEKAEKRILEKKKKEEEKLEKEQKEQHEKINSLNKVQNGFTKEDLDNAVLSAISQYDTLRKQQKKEKRELEKKKMEEEKMRATLARAIQPQQRQNDPWRSLFS